MPTVTHVETRQAQGTTATTSSFAAPAGSLILVTAAAMNNTADMPALTITDSGLKSGSWTPLAAQLNQSSPGQFGASRAWWAASNGATGSITVSTSVGGSNSVVAFAVEYVTGTAGIEASSWSSQDISSDPIGAALNVALWSPAVTTDLVSTLFIWEKSDTAITPGSGWTETFESTHVTSAAGNGHGSNSGLCLKVQGQKAPATNTDARYVTGSDWWSWRWTVGFLALAGTFGDATAAMTFTAIADGTTVDTAAGDGVASFTFTGLADGDTEPFDQFADGITAIAFSGYSYGSTDAPISFGQAQAGRGTCYLEIPVVGAISGAAEFPLADAWGNEFEDALTLNAWLNTNYPRLRWDPTRHLVTGCALGPLPNLALVESVRGAATGSFAFTTTSAGDYVVVEVLGDANAMIGFTSTSDSEATSTTETGDGTANIAFTPIADGSTTIDVFGDAAAAMTFTSTSDSAVSSGVVAASAQTTRVNSNTAVTTVSPISGELLVVVATVSSLTATTPTLTIADSGVKTGSWTALTSQQNSTAFGMYSGSRVWTAVANGSSGTITITNTASQSDPALAVAVYRVANHNGIENWTIQAGNINLGSGFGALNNTLPWTPAATTLLISTLIIEEYADCTFDPGSGWTELFEPVHITAASGSGHNGAASGTCLKIQGQTATNKTAVSRTTMSGEDWATYHWVIGILQA